MQSHSEVLWVTISTYEFWQGVIQAIRDNLQQLELGAASLDDRTKTKVTVVETNSFSFSLKTGGRQLRASTAAPWSSEVQDPAPPLHLECHFMAQDRSSSVNIWIFVCIRGTGRRKGRRKLPLPFKRGFLEILPHPSVFISLVNHHTSKGG